VEEEHAAAIITQKIRAARFIETDPISMDTLCNHTLYIGDIHWEFPLEQDSPNRASNGVGDTGADPLHWHNIHPTDRERLGEKMGVE
jgi:hypothetical protein